MTEASKGFETFRFIDEEDADLALAAVPSSVTTTAQNDVVILLDDDAPTEKLVPRNISNRRTVKTIKVNAEENLPPNSSGISSSGGVNTNIDAMQLFPPPSIKPISKKPPSTAAKTVVTAAKPKSSIATTSRAINATKSKILKELEKLSASDREELLREIAQGIPSDTKSSTTNDVSISVATSKAATSFDDEDLMKLRLELGEVLNREAELRTKEKKLRISIKKLQRKITMGIEAPSYQIKEDSLEDILTRLFGLTDPPPWEVENDKEMKSNVFASCPLWRLAQQQEESTSLVEDKRVDAERDATIKSPCSDSHPSQLLPTISSANTPITVPYSNAFPSALSQIIAGIESPAMSTRKRATSSKLEQVAEHWSSALSATLLHQNGVQLLSLFEEVFSHFFVSQSQSQSFPEHSDTRLDAILTCYSTWKQAFVFEKTEIPVARQLWNEYIALLFREILHQLTAGRGESVEDSVYVEALVKLLERMVQDGQDLFPLVMSMEVQSETKETEKSHLRPEVVLETLKVYEEEQVDVYDVVPDYDYDVLHDEENIPSTQQAIRKDESLYISSSGDHAPLIGTKRIYDSNNLVCLVDDEDEVNHHEQAWPSRSLVLAKRPKLDQEVVLLSSPDSPPSSISAKAEVRPQETISHNVASSPTAISLFDRLNMKRKQYQSEQAVSLPKDPLISQIEPSWHLYPDYDILSIAEQYGLATDDSIANLRKLLKSMWKTMNVEMSAPTPRPLESIQSTAGKEKAVQPARKQVSSSSSSSVNPKASTRMELTKSMFKDFLNRHIDIYQDILMFIPISVDIVHARLLQENIKVTKKALLAFLDEQAIFVAMRKNHKTTKLTAEADNDNDVNDDDECEGDSMSEVGFD